MIFILSKSNDQSTDHVIEYLNLKKKSFYRINENNTLKYVNINILTSDCLLHFEEKPPVNLKHISGYWYRRGTLKMSAKFKIDYGLLNLPESLRNKIRNNLRFEEEKVIEYIYFLLEKKRRLNKYSDNFINKFVVLDLAREIGISIPKTYLLSNISDKNIKNNDFITKPIGNSLYHSFGKTALMGYTEKINSRNNISSVFPSTIQNLIEKKYEIRSFYLDGKFYSMAILSQKNDQTKVDFRKYDYKKPNRNLPYKLPQKLEYKLNLLMQKLNLVSGSIDLILTPLGKYVFLEVNPVGQFGMTSYPCNYNLEEKIANYLCQCTTSSQDH